ncbi:hypothetical protein CCY99_03585 [Helicobacter sp. 16-1353]|nr:hypothetical protein CCY99_03585 [Helicobacter sp. 16-1353]
MSWILIISAGILEVFWVSGLKYADSFWLYALTGVAILFSFCVMLIAIKYVEVGVAYAVFVGIGTAGVVVAEMVAFGEEVSIIKIALIVMLLIGVVGLKLTSNKSDKKLARDLSAEFGLDSVLDAVNLGESGESIKNVNGADFVESRKNAESINFTESVESAKNKATKAQILLKNGGEK